MGEIGVNQIYAIILFMVGVILAFAVLSLVKVIDDVRSSRREIRRFGKRFVRVGYLLTVALVLGMLWCFVQSVTYLIQ
jgi:hypothetical protein